MHVLFWDSSYVVGLVLNIRLPKRSDKLLILFADSQDD